MAVAALALPASASAADITVNDDDTGPGPAGATCEAPAESSINDAAAAADPGDTILVCAGIYNESVEVDKQLTLRGAKAGIDARERETGSTEIESLITGEPSAANDGGIALNASGIVLDGFVVAAAADPAIDAGIAMSPAHNGQQVLNNIVRDNTVGIVAGSSGGTPSLIRQNLLQGNNAAGPGTGNAINGTENADDLVIDANVFADQENAAIRLTETNSQNTNVQITGNELVATNPDPALNHLRVLLLRTEASEVTGNTLENVEGNAVHLAGGNEGITVQANRIADGDVAIRITDSGPGENQDISVLGNATVHGETGISIAADALAGQLLATGNRIARNQSGIVLDDADATLAADDNWWGCNEGLPSPDCDSIEGANAAAVDASETLWLALEAPRKMRAGKKRNLRAVLRGADECLFPDGTLIQFGTNLGRFRPPSGHPPTADCTSTARLKLRRTHKGKARVSASLDHQGVEKTIRIKRRRR